MLLPLSVGGADTVETFELDVELRELVKDGFSISEGRVSVAWMDIDHILVNHLTHGGLKSKAGWPVTTYLWKRGTPLQSAQQIFQGEETDSISILKSFEAGNQRLGVIMRAIDYTTLVFYLVSPGGVVEEIPFPRKLNLTVNLACTARHIVVSLIEEAVVAGRTVPAGSCTAYDIASDLAPEERLSVVYILGDDEFNTSILTGGLMASKSRIHLVLTKRGVESRVVIAHLQGSWSIVSTEQTPAGSQFSVVSSSSSSDNLILKRSGLLEPSLIWLEARDGATEKLYQQVSLFPAENYTVTRSSALSKDGSEIDYIALYPKSPVQPSGEHPVLMTGYGGFGISFPLGYTEEITGGISIIPWIEAGGALVIPRIRGGGERGEAWHKAGMKEKRQNSFDDFIAVAEKLIADGFTSAKRIGVFGSSNGGLLAAVMGTQRPDLFGAVVSDVPLTDMLRYPKMGMGAAWVYEYGDPEDKEMAAALKSYSPFHNIIPTKAYPPFLVTVSTKDDRVGAGHARKLVARLQEIGSPGSFLLEDQMGGHGVSNSLTNIGLMSRRMAFFRDHLQK
jgi:prolyl oligopeptidase